MVQTNGNDWRSRVMSEVSNTTNKTHEGNPRRGVRVSRFSLEIPPGGLGELLTEAAAMRGASPTGYMRRATLAFIAHDLGLSLTEVVRLDPRFSPTGGNYSVQDPEALLGAPWEIEGLK